MARLRKPKYTTETFKKAIYGKVKDEYSVIGEYIKSSEKIKMRHNICGHEWDVIANNFLNRDTKCPKCFARNIKRKEKEEKECLPEDINGHNIDIDKVPEVTYRYITTENSPELAKRVKEASERIMKRNYQLYKNLEDR